MSGCGSGTGTEGNGPDLRHLQRVVALFLALARGDRPSIQGLTRDMTLEQGTLACFAVGQLLLGHLARATGKSLEDLAAQLSLEMATRTA